jgi:hypothetical protein
VAEVERGEYGGTKTTFGVLLDEPPHSGPTLPSRSKTPVAWTASELTRSIVPSHTLLVPIPTRAMEASPHDDVLSKHRLRLRPNRGCRPLLPPALEGHPVRPGRFFRLLQCS